MVKEAPALKVTLCGASTHSVGSMTRLTAASSRIEPPEDTAPASATPRSDRSPAVERRVSVLPVPPALARNTSSEALEAMVRLPAVAAASVTRNCDRPEPVAFASVMAMSPAALTTLRSSATLTVSPMMPVPAWSDRAPPATLFTPPAPVRTGASVVTWVPLPSPTMEPVVTSRTSVGCAARSRSAPVAGATVREPLRPAVTSRTASVPAAVTVIVPS